MLPGALRIDQGLSKRAPVAALFPAPMVLFDRGDTVATKCKRADPKLPRPALGRLPQ